MDCRSIIRMKTLYDNIFKTRINDSDEKGGCTFIGGAWKDVTTDELFKDKTIVMFGLPGAFTPTCSGEQLPKYEERYVERYDVHTSTQTCDERCR